MADETPRLVQMSDDIRALANAAKEAGLEILDEPSNEVLIEFPSMYAAAKFAETYHGKGWDITIDNFYGPHHLHTPVAVCFRWDTMVSILARKRIETTFRNSS